MNKEDSFDKLLSDIEEKMKTKAAFVRSQFMQKSNAEALTKKFCRR